MFAICLRTFRTTFNLGYKDVNPLEESRGVVVTNSRNLRSCVKLLKNFEQLFEVVNDLVIK